MTYIPTQAALRRWTIPKNLYGPSPELSQPGTVLSRASSGAHCPAQRRSEQLACFALLPNAAIRFRQTGSQVVAIAR